MTHLDSLFQHYHPHATEFNYDSPAAVPAPAPVANPGSENTVPSDSHTDAAAHTSASTNNSHSSTRGRHTGTTHTAAAAPPLVNLGDHRPPLIKLHALSKHKSTTSHPTHSPIASLSPQSSTTHSVSNLAVSHRTPYRPWSDTYIPPETNELDDTALPAVAFTVGEHYTR